MKRKLLVVLAAMGCLALVSSAAPAHHGVAGYDMTKTITLHGTVTKFDWSNPHVVVFVDAKNDSGQMQNWDHRVRRAGTHGSRRVEQERVEAGRRHRD